MRTYFVISLSLMIRLISSTITELIYTLPIVSLCATSIAGFVAKHTLFSNQAVVAIVGVVGVACDSTAPITDDAEVKL